MLFFWDAMLCRKVLEFGEVDSLILKVNSLRSFETSGDYTERQGVTSQNTLISSNAQWLEILKCLYPLPPLAFYRQLSQQLNAYVGTRPYRKPDTNSWPQVSVHYRHGVCNDRVCSVAVTGQLTAVYCDREAVTDQLTAVYCDREAATGQLTAVYCDREAVTGQLTAVYCDREAATGQLTAVYCDREAVTGQLTAVYCYRETVCSVCLT
jgi:hypothetical protein